MTKSKKQQEAVKKSSRRDFLKKATLSTITGLMATQGFSTNDPNFYVNDKKTNSQDLKLSVAGYNVNRVKSLVDGRVKIKGCSIKFVKAAIGDMNASTFSGNQPYDITEIGLHPFMLAFANDDFRDYTLLPIFPLRIFRHKSVFIRNDRGIKSAMDLKGLTIGTPGYS